MQYDLTDLPTGYDRGRDHGPEVLGLWLDALQRRVQVGGTSLILDLGSGTGRFSPGLARRFGAEVIGLDPSSKMLEQARIKGNDPRVRYWIGEAEQIPLPSRSCDLVFMSMSYHHFADKARALAECARVVSARGRVAIRTGTRERIDAYPYVSFFPSARAILEKLLPDRPGLEAAFTTAGFTLLSADVVEQKIAPDWPSYAEKLAAGGDSVIAQLGSDELEDGLDFVRKHRAQGDQSVIEPIDLLVFRLRETT